MQFYKASKLIEERFGITIPESEILLNTVIAKEPEPIVADEISISASRKSNDYNEYNY